MMDDAKIKTNFLKPTHLIDHDLKMLLGMIWAIILDYAISPLNSFSSRRHKNELECKHNSSMLVLN